MVPRLRRRRAVLTLFAGVLLLLCASVPATQRADKIAALQEGGYVLYFRHGATDWSQHDRIGSEATLASCDPTRMRQLSEAGRRTVRAVGAALRRLAVPVDVVYASEYCRCVQTAELLGLGPVETTRDILNMHAARYVGGREALAASARKRLATPPPAASNVVLVAHGNVLLEVAGVRPPEAGAVIVLPRGDGRFEIVGSLSAEDWIAAARETVHTIE